MSILLADLPNAVPAIVQTVCTHDVHLGESHLRRLGELGFLPGEPVQIVRRGPGGREPLAVVVGETMFALRLIEARCIRVSLVDDYVRSFR